MEELERKIEYAMPREDADQTPRQDVRPVGGSFVQDPDKVKKVQEKRLPTVLDVLLYLGKQLKEIKEQNVVLTELLKTFLKASSPSDFHLTRSFPAPQMEPTVQNGPRSAPITQTDEGMDKVRKALSEYIVDGSLTVNNTENTMFYIIKSTKFLGSENFAKIASIVRSLGGQYISQGKASHFEVPKGLK